MSDARTIQGTIKVESTGREAVALDLMSKIASHEDREKFVKDRAYWITLYAQSLKAVSGYDANTILQSK